MIKTHEPTITGSVFETTDYEYFKSNLLNRQVSETKLNKMIDSFNEYGQQIPVLVDKKGNVIDGHHRIEICKRLEISVIYIETEHNDPALIQAINDNQHSWTIQDHIEYHAKRGNQDYKKALELGEEYGIRAGIIANSLGLKGLGTNDIKGGRFKIRDEDLLRKFLEFHKRFYFLPNRKQAYFVQSLFHVWSKPKVEEQRLFQQIVKNKELFEFSVPKYEFIQRMKDEYNKNLRSETTKI